MQPFRTYILAALVFIVLGASACFDIEENYHFRKDGSGTAQVTVDISQMMSMLKSFSQSMDSLGGIPNRWTRYLPRTRRWPI
jgi:hypothetical protein